MNYYNEIEPYAVAWLQNLIEAEHIGAGVVDDRSICDLALDTASGFERGHFFAGIGGWEYALRLAGWPDDRPVWTGSCPCQPFSVAGKRKGIADDRHLWPIWYQHIRQCRPPTVFGEQVASKDGREWLIGVRLDLEALGYVFGAADLCAAGVGAPHIRQRLYWVADVSESRCARAEDSRADSADEIKRARRLESERGGADSRVAHPTSAELRREPSARDEPQHGEDNRDGWLGDTDHTRPQGRQFDSGEHSDQHSLLGRASKPSGLGNATFRGDRALDGKSRPGTRREIPHRGSSLSRERLGNASPDGRRPGRGLHPSDESRDGNTETVRGSHRQHPDAPSATGFWSDFDLIPCADGKARRIEPGTFPLAHGIPARVGKLRAYGNAIVPQVAAEFIKAFLEAERDR